VQDTKSILKEQDVKTAKSINSFFRKFEIYKILYKSKINKVRGVPVKDVLISIMQLPFVQKNFYQGIVKNSELGFNKTVAYGLMNNSKYNWRLFLGKIAAIIINNFLLPLTSDAREDVLIIDDTGYPRNRSKKVELLANVYDHAKMAYFRGFRLMQLGWSDGNSFVPVDFALMSSAKKKNRFQEANGKIDKRSCGSKRRKEAVCKSTDLIVPMIKRALAKGIKAKYLLMDSWYGFPSITLAAKEYIDVICMVKNTPKIFYHKDGNALTLDQIYKGFRKRRGKANIKGSQIVEIGRGEESIEVKIVFVRNRNKKRSWLAILSTDISLSDEDVVRIYGKRWDIEVFFKMAKHCLNLCKEAEMRSFDGMVAHITIVQLRYMFLAVEQRKSDDSKTFGGVFLELIDEMKDLALADALARILCLAFEKLKAISGGSDEMAGKINGIFMGLVMEKFGIKANIT
jgi:hypothetical protein